LPLKIHNTLSGLREELTPGGTKKENIADYPPVTIYSCGPTVYSYAHIGNFRTFVFNDFLNRYLKFRGFKVRHAMNITDVDDKTITGANKDGVTLKEYTEKYTDIFLEDLKSLNINPVDYMPKATESIDAMIDILNRLKDKGIAYEKDGSLYFSIAKFPQYGRLSRLDQREIKSGLRYDTDSYEKEDARDFALWKAAAPGEPSWETPFGSGRPGWHIECSAMIRKIFGSTIDIHTGGVDLIFPHHENEIAQSEAAYGERFVRHWIHSEHLLVDGAKMSKSLGNFYTLRDIVAKGFTPRSIRYLLLSAHYKKQLNFTFDGLKQTDAALERIDNFIIRLNDIKHEEKNNSDIDKMISEFISKFTESMDDDLNTAGGLGVLFDFIHEVNSLIDSKIISKSDTQKVFDALKKVDSVLGCIFYKDKKEDDIDTGRIESLIKERIGAKAQKNFKRADEIRDALLKEGVILEDSKDGTRWKIKK
jgi:cysteinyl-tRNA synthetase